jgi:hypothetical protein
MTAGFRDDSMQTCAVHSYQRLIGDCSHDTKRVTHNFVLLYEKMHTYTNLHLDFDYLDNGGTMLFRKNGADIPSARRHTQEYTYEIIISSAMKISNLTQLVRNFIRN